MEKLDKQAVLVLGMHRSGTSAFTAGLHKAFGIPLGNIEKHKDHANQKGYFENSMTWRINDRLLAEIGSSWDSYSVNEIVSPMVNNYNEYKGESLTFLQENFSENAIFAMKDPRMTVLLPFWEDVIQAFGAHVLRIIVIRHPLEVALSQKTRFERSSYKDFHSCGSDLRYVLNLWFWYNLRLLNDLPDDNNIIIAFDTLMSDPTEQMQRIGRFLDMEPDSAKLNEYSQSFLEKSLKRHNVCDEETEQYNKSYSYVFELYNLMKRYALEHSFSRESAQTIIQAMPNIDILQSWASPINDKLTTTKTRLTKLEKSQIAPSIIWRIKKMYYKFMSSKKKND